MESFIQGIRDPVAAPVTVALCAISGVLNVPPRSRRALSVAVAALTLFAPWFASSEASIVRFLCAGGTAMAVFRNLDLYRDRRRWSIARRAAHLISVIDSRRLKCLVPHIDRTSWLRVGAFGLPTVITVWLLLRSGTPSSVAGYSVRWLFGALWAYTSIETLAALALAGCRLAGVELPKLHDNPILSRTLSEFWGRRWNLSVHYMLLDHCFRPLARRAGLSIALLGTFAASAVLHSWLVLAAGGLLMAASMASFFLLQGVLVIVEQRLGVRYWWRPMQHGWTMGCVLLTLPLLLEPLLKIAFG